MWAWQRGWSDLDPESRTALVSRACATGMRNRVRQFLEVEVQCLRNGAEDDTDVGMPQAAERVIYDVLYNNGAANSNACKYGALAVPCLTNR